MKIRILLTALLLSLALRSAATGHQELSVIPRPQSYTLTEGEFMLTTATVLVCDEGLEELSAYVTNYLPLHRIDGSPWTVGTTLRLSLDATLSAEAYTLDVTSHGITIVGGDYGGVFNGVQTLLQLLPAEVYSGTAALPMALPLCHIEDRPRFAYRGFMLDIVRTWMGPERVKRHIDLISHLKINKLHIPICNDEGWRLEIKSHPELTEIGAWRGGDSPVMAVYGKWNEKYGGYYTQEQMKELIHYAAVRNVEIIPEIDLPGHSRNFARVHPEILCNYTPNLALTAGYDYRSVWCAAREENYMLLADILKEVAALFPSHHIHIGGDEVDMEQWEKCPDCQALRHRKGLVDGHALEQYFLGRLIEQLRALGKEPAVWNEAIKGDALATTTRVHGWENLKACQEAATKGYQTIVMPGAYFYFDMRQTATEDGHDWAGIFDVQKCYDFDFARCGFTEQQLAHVQGVEGAFWSEAYASHSPETPDYLDYMTFPRTCALSEIGWCDGTRQWDDFNKRLHRYYDCMGAQGICFRLMPPTVEYEQGVLTAQSDAQSELTYTVEGGTPIPYTAPITTQCPEYYLFQSHYLSGHSPEQGAAAYYVQQYPEVKITTSMGESKQFPLSRAEEYKGIARTARTCRVDDWIRYDFTDALICRELSIATGNIQLPRFTFTTGYVELSYDGKNFTRCGELEKGAWRVYRPKAAIRAIRVVATCEGNGCPFVTIQSPKIK